MRPPRATDGWLPSLLLMVGGLPAQSAPVRAELRSTFPVDGGTITAAAFAADGSALATGGELGDLRVLDLPARTVRWRMTPSDYRITKVAFSPDGHRLACSGSTGRDLTLHDAKTGQELLRVASVGSQRFAWHRDGTRFAYACDSHVVLHDGKHTGVLATFENAVTALTFADDGAVFVGDYIGRLWWVPPGGGKPELRFDHRQTKDDPVRSIDVAWAGGTVFDLPSRGTLRRGTETFDVPGASYALAVSVDGSAFAVGGAESTVRWWREQGKVSDDLAVPGIVAALALHPDGQTLFVSTHQGRQALYTRGQKTIEAPAHPGFVQGLAMSPDGTVLAIKGSAWTLQPLDGRPPRALPAALAVDAGRRGAELLVQLADRVVVLDARRDVETGSVPCPRPYGKRNAAGPGDQLLVEGKFVDVASRAVTELPRSLLVHTICDVAHAHDGRWAVAAVAGIEGELGGLLVTDPTGKAGRIADDGPVYTVAFSPDGRRLYYGCGDGISVGMGPPEHFLRVRDAETLDLLHQVSAQVWWWRFLDDRRALAFVGDKLQVWDVDRLGPTQTLALDGACHTFQLSEDRRTLVGATLQDVRVYRLVF